LIAATCKVFQYLKKDLPYAYLVGDTGKGYGSKRLYEFFTNDIKNRSFDTLTFHYLLPDADWCNKILFVIEDLPKRPFLIADAGFMYAAKMSGNATIFDLFTPDPGELAFLADEEAPHPFYTRGFLLQDESRVEELIQRAYKHNNSSKYMLVKGNRDYIVKEGKILDIISEPCIEALEAIGGTGDTLTGITSALIDSGFPAEKAMILSAKINRIMGILSNPDPSMQVGEIIKFIPEAIKINIL
jgi:Predicted sugar kinase